jgi:hypothetical protein
MEPVGSGGSVVVPVGVTGAHDIDRPAAAVTNRWEAGDAVRTKDDRDRVCSHDAGGGFVGQRSRG